MTFELHLGPAEERLQALPTSSVDAIVTDPPYEIGFMGKSWDSTGIAYQVSLWRECLRVLKPGGHLLAFGGTRTFHRMVCAIEDAGFEIRDMLEWIYGSGFPKSKNLAEEWAGWGTALKPAHEPITLARKPLQGSVSANVTQHGTGALNIDACRIHSPDAEGYTYTNKRLMPGAFINKGQIWHQETSYQGTCKPGRWPANILHDGSPEVVSVFPVESGANSPVRGTEPAASGFQKNVSFLGRKQRVDQSLTFQNDSGSAARFFYCPKTSSADRNEGCAHLPDKDWSGEGACIPERESRPFHPSKNHHPTVKPTELMRYLCRLITPPGGIILDPFMGSGSTGKAALLEGFHFIGVDKTPEWHPIARARLEHAAATRLRQTQATAAPSTRQLEFKLD